MQNTVIAHNFILIKLSSNYFIQQLLPMENFSYLKNQADAGDCAAQIEVGRAYELGDSPAGVNYDMCHKYYMMAAMQGDALGENNLGWCYEKGYGVAQNYKEAVKWYQKSADKGNAYGAANLAHMYVMELGVEYDAEMFLKYTKIGAEGDNPICLYNLGTMYLSGKMIEKDPKKAQKYIEKAASLGHPGAQKLLDDVHGDLSVLEVVPDKTDVLQQAVNDFNAGNVEAALAAVHSEVDKGNSGAMLLFAQMIDDLIGNEEYIFARDRSSHKYFLCIIDREVGSPRVKQSWALPENICLGEELVTHYITKAAELGNQEAKEILKTIGVSKTEDTGKKSDSGTAKAVSSPTKEEKKGGIGRFVKNVLASIATHLMEPSFYSSIGEYLRCDSEFNLKIMPCYDSNYAAEKFVDFLNNYASDVDVKEKQTGTRIKFSFEDNDYTAYVHYHYARVINVVMSVSPGGREEHEIIDYCNKVNKVDLIHQMGYDYLSGCVRIIRQILITPSIGDVSTIKKVLLELAEYADKVKMMQVPAQDDWKRYAMHDQSASLSNPLRGAEDLIFPKRTKDRSSDSIMVSFAEKIKIISEDSEKIVHTPLTLVENGTMICYKQESYIKTSDWDKDKTITTYREYPYLFTIEGTVDVEKITCKPFDPSRMERILLERNSRCHFTLARYVWEKKSNGKTYVRIIMNGLYGEDGNTRTDVNLFVLYDKLIAMLRYDCAKK